MDSRVCCSHRCPNLFLLCLSSSSRKQEEGFNATKLSQLVDCLEAGIDIIPVDDHALFQSTGSQTSVAAVGLETATADAMEVEASPESTTTPSKNDKKKAKSPGTTPAKSPGKTPSKSPGKAK
jgi:hypothetical protein